MSSKNETMNSPIQKSLLKPLFNGVLCVIYYLKKHFKPFFILKALKDILQHFKFVNWWSRGFVFFLSRTILLNPLCFDKIDAFGLKSAPWGGKFQSGRALRVQNRVRQFGPQMNQNSGLIHMFTLKTKLKALRVKNRVKSGSLSRNRSN